MPRSTTALALRLLVLNPALAAQAGDWTNSAMYNGYGAGAQIQASNYSMRDSNRNLTLVNGQVAPSIYQQGSVAQYVGGVPLDEARAVKSYPGANQGSLIVFIDPARFIDPAVLRHEVDEYHRILTQLVPFGDTERATLPGRLEWEREQRWVTEGVPVGSRHREELSTIAGEFGVPVPWH